MSRTDFWPAHTITVLEHLVAGVVRTDADVQPLVVDLLEADPGKLLHALRGERPGGLPVLPLPRTHLGNIGKALVSRRSLQCWRCV
jgi:hypothetical protein